MNHRQDAWDFTAAGVLQGLVANPQIFPSLESVRNVLKPGSETYKVLVDAAAKIADEMCGVSEQRFSWIRTPVKRKAIPTRKAV